MDEELSAQLPASHFYMKELDALFAALGKSEFRSRFQLGPSERRYLDEKGFDAVIAHAREFIHVRLAPAEPKNDGRQTPMRGHPVFIAQHATATCCRSCLAKWHDLATGKRLTNEEIDYVVRVLSEWIKRQDFSAASVPAKRASDQQMLFD